MTATILSFLACLLGFTLVGALASRERSATTDDYLVASRNVSPWLTALSSVATNNSGFMFIGLIGFTYRFGVQAVWLQGGWVLGDLLVWLWIHRRVRRVSGELNVASVPALLGAARRGARRSPSVVLLAGLLTLFFLGGYAAAQLKAGSAALEVLFGWDARVGAVVGAVIVVVYCFSGGLRASIWTDAAQSLVMIGSMGLLLTAAVLRVGGPGELLAQLAGQDPALVDWVPRGLSFGLITYVLGFVAGGFGAIGQPHILIRSMAIRSADDIPRARRIYFVWFVAFSFAAVGAGLYARAVLPEMLSGLSPDEAARGAELALPRLSRALLPNALVGLMLAGIFSATLSTADSQILSCGAAVTQDILPKYRNSYVASKLATLGVTALALALALWAEEGVFELVLIAWSALGASLGPLLVLRVFGREVSPPIALTMMVSGLCTVVAWDATPWAGDVFKLLPGLLVPACVYGVSQLARSVDRPA